jgi:hypothetical protein
MENTTAQKSPRSHSLRGNGGYYSLVMGDTVVFSILLTVNLMLINLPLSVLLGAINFGVNLFAGIKAEPAPAHKNDPALQVAALAADGRKPKKSLFKSTGAFAKKARSFISKTMRDPKVVVGSEGAAAGSNLLFQALWGIHSIVTTHSLIFIGAVTGLAATGAVAGCALVGAFGFFCIVAGTLDKWKGFSRFFTSSFRKGSHASAQPVERPSRWLAKRPRLQKFMKSKFARRTKDALMILLTLESSIFVIGASTTLIAQRVSSIISNPGTILTGIVPLAIAINWGKTPVINFIAVGRLTLGRHIKKAFQKLRHKNKPADTPLPELSAETALPQPPESVLLVAAANTALTENAVTETFNKSSGNDAGSVVLPEKLAQTGDAPPSPVAAAKKPRNNI